MILLCSGVHQGRVLWVRLSFFCEQRVILAGWRRLHHGTLLCTRADALGATESSVSIVATRSERLALFVGFSFSSY